MLRKTTQTLVGAILVLGLLFKFMHWPGAGVLIYSSLLAVSLLLIDHIIQNRKPKLLSRQNIASLLGVFYVLSIAFKVCHLPGTGILLIVSLVGLSVLLVEFAYSIRKSIHAVLPLLFSITLFFALFKIMHWPKPPYALYGSYFGFALLLPVLLFSRGIKLKSAYASLSNHFLILGMMTLLIFLLEFTTKICPECLNIEHYQMRIFQMLLFAGSILFIEKIRQIEPLKTAFASDYKLLKCVQGIYLIMLVMLVLIAR